MDKNWEMHEQSLIYVCKSEEKLFTDYTPDPCIDNLVIENVRCVDQNAEDAKFQVKLETVIEACGTDENTYILEVSKGSKTYTCDICSKVFCKNSNLKRHYRSHTGDNPYACDMCTASFPTQSRLKEHQNTHSGLRPHACKLCGKSFARVSNLSRHYRTHGGKKLYQCEICNGRFLEPTRLREHYLIHTGEKKFSCEVCGKRFLKKYNLKRHYSTHGTKQPYASTYACNVCGRCFSKRLYLLQHKASHVKLPTNQTVLTNMEEMTLSTTDFERKHQQVTNSPKDQNISLSVVQEEVNLVSPDFAVSLEQKVLESYDDSSECPDEQEEILFSCNLCTRSFIKKSSLTLHLKKHHEENNEAKCSICHATFSYESRLKEHFVIHSGEKPFPCAACGRRFSRNSNLLRHLQTHTGEKRHQCTICHKWYSSSTRLKEHHLIHTGAKPHLCSTCGTSFRHKSALERHCLVHKRTNRLECSICHKRYTRKTRLKNHYRVCHNGLIQEDGSSIESRPNPRLNNLIQTLEKRLGEPKVDFDSNSCSAKQEIKQNPTKKYYSHDGSCNDSTITAEHQLTKLIGTLEAHLEKPKNVCQSDSDKEDSFISKPNSELRKTSILHTTGISSEQITNPDSTKSESRNSCSPEKKLTKNKPIRKRKASNKNKVLSLSC